MSLINGLLINNNGVNMIRVYNFLAQLKENNNREWFNSHKEEYKAVQAVFNDFTEQLISRIEIWDEDIKNSALQVKDCTYRIYRDTRFSKDKTPYKTHMGAYICPRGKKSPYAGYYFHIEPAVQESAPGGGVASEIKTNGVAISPGNAANGFLGRSLLAGGLYCPEPKVIASLRDEISVNGDTFLEAIAQADGFSLEDFDTLKRLPRGFEHAEERWHNLLKHKDFSIAAPLPEKLISGNQEALLDYVNEKFRTCRRFNHLLNLAVDYALEEL